MATRNGLKDVDPFAITICKQGANRQRIFLRKSADVAENELLTLPHAPAALFKQADNDGGWSTFYCVVAEPGAEEDPGMTGDRDSVDVWLDADEIRKAAHRLQKNKAYVNLVHDGLAEDGLSIVETAVALADLEIEGPDGETQVIKKDSWYVAIECNEDAIAKVDEGEITGVSLEGSGIRVPLEKSTPTDLAKALSFAETIGERELTDSLYRAWSTLESVIYDVFRDEDVSDPKALVRTALSEFETYLLGKLDAIPADSSEGLAKVLGTLDDTSSTEDEDMGLKEDFETFKKEQEERSADLKKSSDAATAAVEGLVGLTSQLVDRVEALGAKPKEGEETEVKKDGEKPTVSAAVEALGKIADRMDEQDEALEALAKSIEALGEGDTDQPADGDRILKTDPKRPLAGLLA